MMSDYRRLTKEETEHYEKTGLLPKDYNSKIIYLFGIDQKIKNEISLFDIINNERKNDE